ncbi:hypothetical protein SGPA1_12242 [Streptomyces misionensis JCM 4497]
MRWCPHAGMAPARLSRRRSRPGHPDLGPVPAGRRGPGVSGVRGDGRGEGRADGGGRRGRGRTGGDGRGPGPGQAGLDPADGARRPLARARDRQRPARGAGAAAAGARDPAHQRAAALGRRRFEGAGEHRLPVPRRPRLLREARTARRRQRGRPRGARRADAARGAVGRHGGHGAGEAGRGAPGGAAADGAGTGRPLRRRAAQVGHPVRSARHRQDQLRQGGRLPARLAVRGAVPVPARRRHQRGAGHGAAGGVRGPGGAGLGGAVHRRGGGDRRRAFRQGGRSRPRGDQRTPQADPRVPRARRPAAGVRDQLRTVPGRRLPAAGAVRLRHPHRPAGPDRPRGHLDPLPQGRGRLGRPRSAGRRHRAVHPGRHRVRRPQGGAVGLRARGRRAPGPPGPHRGLHGRGLRNPPHPHAPGDQGVPRGHRHVHPALSAAPRPTRRTRTPSDARAPRPTHGHPAARRGEAADGRVRGRPGSRLRSWRCRSRSGTGRRSTAPARTRR